MKSKIFVLFIVCLCKQILFAQKTELLLSNGWEFKQSNQSKYYPAEVPGNVIIDLHHNKLIADPFFSNNEKKLQWIENEDWEYKLIFNCNQTFLENTNQELLFEGLDTYAKVFLNDSLILNANNMFRSWHVNVKNNLRLGENVLKVVFKTACNIAKTKANQLNYQLPEGERVFARKAQFQFGWDFGPRFVACGIWKPIKLIAWNLAKINSWHYQIKSMNDSLAQVQLFVETESQTNKSFNYNWSYTSKDEYGARLIKGNKTNLFEKGIHEDTILIQIKNPKLWWCNGMGEPFMYHIKLSLNDSKWKLDEKMISIGLRKIELITTKDSIGNAFYFKLNETPIFIKGANYIPSDIFLKEQTFTPEINRYKQANINMLRVWGGGVYGDEEFYKACDRNGILVWQDFMFACAMYPGDSAFINNVKEEVKEQILNIRNHPSLALWCGNNEIDEAWHNWGWQNQFKYSKKDSSKIWADYQMLFHQLIPEIKNQYNPETAYWPSSPSIGWGHNQSLKQGDSHYWGVWWGMQPFDIYEKKVGRFMSEYGFQSMPDYNTIQKFCEPNQSSINSDDIKAHQKHKTGFETIKHYLEKDYNVPKDLRNYIYTSQLLQRDGMKLAIESHRTAKPTCMGTLFWQLNDCWPGITWSAIDHDKVPKAFFYALPHLYKNHLLKIKQDQNQISISCITDSTSSFEASVEVKLMNFDSKIVWHKEQSVNMRASYNEIVHFNLNDLPIFDSTLVYLKVDLIHSGKKMACNYYFFTRPKHLKLPNAILNIQTLSTDTYEIQSDVFIKDLFLYNENESVILSDNYFNLEAGQKKIIKIVNAPKQLDKVRFKSLSLNQ